MSDCEILEDGECSSPEETSPKKARLDGDGDVVVVTTAQVPAERIVYDVEDDDDEGADGNVDDGGGGDDDGDDDVRVVSNWSLTIKSKLLGDEPVESDKKEEKAKRVVCCFNCGDDHNLYQCPEPKDMKKIRKAQSEFRAQQQQRGPPSRYHGTEPESKYRPGRIGTNLREALGIGPDDIPEYIYRMRRMGFYNGYPPGYLKQAVSQDTTDLPLTFHCDEGYVPRTEDAKPVAVAEEKLDRSKIYFYMGFNNAYRSLRDRESAHYRTPPFETFCEYLEEEISSKQKKSTRKGRTSASRPSSAQDKLEAVAELPDDDLFIVDTKPAEPQNDDDVIVVEQGEGEQPVVLLETPKAEDGVSGNLSTPVDNMSMGDSIHALLGTPVSSRRADDGSLLRHTLPDISKFAVGIVPFTAKEDCSQRGLFDKIKAVIQKRSSQNGN